MAARLRRTLSWKRSWALGILGAWSLLWGITLGTTARVQAAPQEPLSTTPEARARHLMAARIAQQGVEDPDVLRAMETVPRHLFVPEVLRDQAYEEDRALPIGHSQNIYQPYLVAYMTELLDLDSDDRVLEIGTGSGYHTAILSRLAGRVYSIEIIADLGNKARRLLQQLGYRNVEVQIGDGYQGWPEEAPFDAILLTAAPPEVPPELIEQLAPGGTMVAPVGAGPIQELQVITNTENGIKRDFRGPSVFAPMTRNGDDP